MKHWKDGLAYKLRLLIILEHGFAVRLDVTYLAEADYSSYTTKF